MRFIALALAMLIQESRDVAGSFMRTLLRKVSTGSYFGGAGCWTEDPAKAVDFRMIDRALDFIDKWGLSDVEIAFAFRKGGVKAVPLDRIRVLFCQQ